MKTTGVVRRIDDLGRIVIPKEIRKTLKIRCGDSIEIGVDEHGWVNLKKFSPLGDIEKIGLSLINALETRTKNNFILTDMEKIIATSKPVKKLINRHISAQLEEILLKKEVSQTQKNSYISLCDGVMLEEEMLLYPITVFGDIKGSVIMLRLIEETDQTLMQIIKNFLENYLIE